MKSSKEENLFRSSITDKEQFEKDALMPLSYWEGWIRDISYFMETHTKKAFQKSIQWAQAVIDYKNTGVFQDSDWDGDNFKWE